MKRYRASLITITLCFIWFVFLGFDKTYGGELTEIELNPGNLSAALYVPDSLPESPGLVVALHSCTQSASDYDDETGWTALADEFGFILLFPEQKSANNMIRCFNWFLPDDRVRGKGEPESMKQIIDAVMYRYHVDESKVFITGLSAGGAMAAVMLAVYPEVFAGGAIIAGLPYACVTYGSIMFSVQAAPVCMSLGNSLVRDALEWGSRVRSATDHGGPWPRVSIWHGSKDIIVNPVNGVDLMEQWTDVHGIDQTPDVIEKVNGHIHKMYRDGEGTALVETYEIQSMGHGVPVDPEKGCGIDRFQVSDASLANDYMVDADICSSRLIITFWGMDR